MSLHYVIQESGTVSRGLNRYEGKDKRRQRRRNHIAKDLAKSQYHQRVIPNKTKDFWSEEFDLYNDLMEEEFED